MCVIKRKKKSKLFIIKKYQISQLRQKFVSLRLFKKDLCNYTNLMTFDYTINIMSFFVSRAQCIRAYQVTIRLKLFFYAALLYKVGKPMQHI